MQHEIKIIATTKEKEIKNVEKMNQDMILFAGKAAGVCYMPDNYFEEGIQNEEKALKRAEMTAKNGHHSVFDHGHITMVIKTNKMIAMILNSMGVYATSEKSARYTVTKAETEREQILYDKWINIFIEEINKRYPEKFAENEVKKLAQENARYMLSVFTPTVMMYTVSYRQLILISNYFDEFLNRKCEKTDFTIRLKKEMEDFNKELKKIIPEPLFSDNKDNVLRFITVKEDFKGKKDSIRDAYTVKYFGSFAMLAQAQRHRTLRYSMNLYETGQYGFYIPELLAGTKLAYEWIMDISSIKDVIPQGTIVQITEQGIVEDFILKCKERMCGRAQLEIMRNCEFLIDDFSNNLKHFSKENRKAISNLLDENKMPCARCKSGYKCKEGCKWGAKNCMIREI